MTEKVEEKITSYSKKTWKKTPTVYQMEATECGAASFAMILGYYGAFIGLEQLRVDCGVSRDGCNAKNVLAAGRKYGFNCKGYSKDVKDLLEMPTPCIIHWNFNHFVVFEGVKNNHPYINDPGNGRRKLSWQDLEDCFTGIVLTFEKNENFKPVKRQSTLLKYTASRVGKQKAVLISLLITGLILVIPGTIIPVFSQFFIDYIIGKGNTDWTIYLLIFMLFTVIFQDFFTWLKSVTLDKLQLKMAVVSGNNFLSHMLSLPIEFFSQRYAGDLSQRVENNNAVNNFLTGDLAEAVLNIITSIFFLILLVIYSPILTVIGVIGCVINIVLSLVLSNKLTDISKKGSQDSSKMTGALYSGLTITSTLKASGCENEYVSRLLGYCAKTAETEQKVGHTQQILSAVPGAVSKMTDIVVLIVGGLFVIQGNITSGMLVAFTQLLTSFTSPVNALVGFFQQIKTTKANISRVEDLENYKTIERAKDNDGLIKEKLDGHLVLKNISYGYSPLAPAFINDFNLELDPGKTIALVGRSASGKSTVGKLISGLIDPWDGEVLFDGKKRLDISADVFSSSVSTVSQDINIFSGSIKDNLTLWNPLVIESEIIEACKDACIHDFITTLPGAYDFNLSEGGSNFSGGQRQRIEIARALINNPTTLVLDEATSALDPIVEKEIMNNLRRRGCSCVIVAHRLSTIRDADEIIVLDHGRIKERGNHKQLLELNGEYAKLIKNA